MALLKTLITSAQCLRFLTMNDAACLGVCQVHAIRRYFASQTEKDETTKQIDDNQQQSTLKDMSMMDKLRPGNGYIPTAAIYQETFNGLKFPHLPTVHITCTRNNTKAWFSQKDEDGKLIISQTSAGECGYKNREKSTAAAAQTLGYQLGRMMKKRGMPFIRVEFGGPGQRFSVLNGLLIGGATIVSITDKTYPTFNLRPKSMRRI